MERHRNLCVLPSNAPALPALHLAVSKGPFLERICEDFNHGIDCGVCSLCHICSICQRPDHGAHTCKSSILQVSSGNVGSNAFDFGPLDSEVDTKLAIGQIYDTGSPSIFTSAPHHSAQSALKSERRKRRRHQTSNCGQQKWSHLVQQSERCEAPNWYHIERRSRKYMKYRDKVNEKAKSMKDKGQIWPDHVEEAFQTALRLFRKRGRSKMELNGKQRGANEFISDYIEKVTGELRGRKKVSSHIQVLKNFLRDIPEWMDLVTAWPDKGAKGAKGESARNGEEITFNDFATNQHASNSDRHPLNPTLQPPQEILGSNVPRGPTIRRVEFAMTLFNQENRGLHTYSSIQSQMGTAPRCLDEISDWRSVYPQLAINSDKGQVACPIFLFETHLSLMDEYPRGPASLGIELDVEFTHGNDYDDWRSLTDFYEDNGQRIDVSKFYEDSQLESSPSIPLECTHIHGTNDTKLVIPLTSKWWASVFFDIIEKKYKARMAREPEATKQQDDTARLYFSNLSVMQELWATPRTPESQSQRMAILLWKFSQTRKGEVATTSWRRLTPPVSAFQIQSPAPQLLEPPMNLDSTLEDNIMRQAVALYPGFYSNQPSIFAENSESLLTGPMEEGSSPDTTTAPDYHSFPSSTSTSYLSSDSNSTRQSHRRSQPSSYDSQDSAYPSFESFDSQGSTYQTHDAGLDSQDLAYGSQDAIYDSQHNSFFAPVVEHLPYESHSTAEIIYRDSDQQHFTGGEIQLSYAEGIESHLAYEVPLIAPRAPMMAQNHLLDLQHYNEQLEQQCDFHPNAPDENIEILVEGGQVREPGGQMSEQDSQEFYHDSQLLQHEYEKRDWQLYQSAGQIEGQIVDEGREHVGEMEAQAQQVDEVFHEQGTLEEMNEQDLAHVEGEEESR